MTYSVRKSFAINELRDIAIPNSVLSKKCMNEALLKPLYISNIAYYPEHTFHSLQKLQGADTNTFVYCSKGCGTLALRGVVYKIEAGDFFCIPRKVAHRYMADEQQSWCLYTIHFKGELAADIVERITKPAGTRGKIKTSEKAIELFEQMYDQLVINFDTASLISASMNLWSFFNCFIEKEPTIKTDIPSVKQNVDIAIDFIKNHLNDKLTLDEMAVSANLSISRFSSLFKKKTGLPPIEYFNQLKVKKACQYLHTTTMTIREISKEVGIEDQYYFSRMFKKEMGIAPNMYRERISA